MAKETTPNGVRRVQGFARFFKGYMGTAAIVTACLPIPVTMLNAIPTFSAHTKILATYTPLFCFLLLGLIFYYRHSLAPVMFPVAASNPEDAPAGMREWPLSRFISRLPALLIAASFCCMYGYHAVLKHAVRELERASTDTLISFSFSEALSSTQLQDVPLSTPLMTLYLVMFMAAEAAFILMAVREYLQDVLGLSDVRLIRRGQPASDDIPKSKVEA